MVLALLAVLFLPQDARAQVIRDTEIEQTLKEWMKPLLDAANMGEDSVNLILVNSPQVNAFVAGGANIFIYSGLIMKTENPGEVIGVLAHELGHITGGHLVTTRDALERASYESILGMVLGVGAAIATGDARAAAALSSAGSHVAGRRFLAFSRVNESSADQAALSFLNQAGINGTGLTSFLKKLEDEELLPASQQSEYIRTHPITRNRIEALENRIEQSDFSGQNYKPEWIKAHNRIKAKLIAFIAPEQVSWMFDDRNQSVEANYARTIAAYRLNQEQKALDLIDTLIKAEPNNPYFHELKGQMLVDFTRVRDALPSYKKAVSLDQDAALIRTAYAHALIESAGSNKQQYNQAIEHLKFSLQEEPRSARAHRLIATAYGRTDREALAKLHLAEEALLLRKIPYAKRQAEAALLGLEENSRDWIKARDILSYIETLGKNDKSIR